MYRFIAFSWPDSPNECVENIRRQMTAIKARDDELWSLAYRVDGLEVWHAGAQPGLMTCTDIPDGGILLGRKISSTHGYSEWRTCSLSQSAGSNDPVAKARWLFSNIWGRYIGFFPGEGRCPLTVVRDPSGGLPCYRVRWNDVDIFTSNVELLKHLPGPRPSINLDSLLANVLIPLISKAHTSLDGVTEVLPAECASFGKEVSSQFLWNPFDIANAGSGMTTKAAAALMKHRLCDVVDAMVRPYDHVLHNLGGLDSSILLACLARSPSVSDLTCVNFYTSSFAGDERSYTRKMAAYAQTPMVERQLNSECVKLDRWRIQEMGASPPPMFDCLTLAGDVEGLSKELGVDALTYGTGGDSVFFQAPYIFSALDYVTMREPIGGLGRAALEAAQYGGRSLASTLFEMLSERFRPRPCFDTIIDLLDPGAISNFLNFDLLENWRSADQLHPMLRPHDTFPKGKYFQIIGSCFFDLEAHRHRFPVQSAVDHICPLLAQPFVELCLQIDSWKLVDGGVSRGLARRAFHDDLPKEIVGRTSKSASDGIYDRLFVQNQQELRTTLLDGVLIQSGLFNRNQLEESLNPQRNQLNAMDPALMFDMYAWETWARRWHE